MHRLLKRCLLLFSDLLDTVHLPHCDVTPPEHAGHSLCLARCLDHTLEIAAIEHPGALHRTRAQRDECGDRRGIEI